MAEKVLATAAVAFVLSFLSIRWFGDTKRNHAWEAIAAVVLFVSTVTWIADIFYLIWR